MEEIDSVEWGSSREFQIDKTEAEGTKEWREAVLEKETTMCLRDRSVHNFQLHHIDFTMLFFLISVKHTCSGFKFIITYYVIKQVEPSIFLYGYYSNITAHDAACIQILATSLLKKKKLVKWHNQKMYVIFFLTMYRMQNSASQKSQRQGSAEKSYSKMSIIHSALM